MGLNDGTSGTVTLRKGLTRLQELPEGEIKAAC